MSLSDNIRDDDDRENCILETKDVKDFIKKLKEIPNKSLELSGLDLCGCSQDDVWESAIEWFKERINKLVGDKLI